MSDKELTVEVVKSYMQSFCQYKNSSGANTTSPITVENLTSLIKTTYNTIKSLN